MMEKYKKRLGNFGEKVAAEYLKKHGYTIRGRNFRCAFGEIDLVAEKEQTIVFAEVKTRSSDTFGTPAEAVSRKKQRHIWKSAELYLSENPWEGDIRFDVIEIYAKAVLTDRFCVDKLMHITDVIMEV